MQTAGKSGLSNQPLLTIAIPTYNRASHLDLCLKRISEELASLDEDQRCLVNVYVSDNASTDDTSIVSAKYQGMLDGALEVVRNLNNSGPDSNIAQCYESATTAYVWILGDDDVILPKGLRMVLDVLFRKEVDVLYVNSYWFENDYLKKPMRFEKHGTLYFKNSIEIARRGVMLSFISGLIVRSGVRLDSRSELTKSNLIQLSWVFPLMRDGKNFAAINNWVVAGKISNHYENWVATAKGSNIGSYGLIDVFGGNLQKIASSILKDRPKLLRAIQNSSIVYFFPGFILELRHASLKSANNKISASLEGLYGRNWRYYVFLAPLFALPIPIAHLYNLGLRVLCKLFRFVVV